MHGAHARTIQNLKRYDDQTKGKCSSNQEDLNKRDYPIIYNTERRHYRYEKRERERADLEETGGRSEGDEREGKRWWIEREKDMGTVHGRRTKTRERNTVCLRERFQRNLVYILGKIDGI